MPLLTISLFSDDLLKPLAGSVPWLCLQCCTVSLSPVQPMNFEKNIDAAPELEYNSNTVLPDSGLAKPESRFVEREEG